MADREQQWVPEAFGAYTIFERLGLGGMASVHRAVHRQTGTEVAIKRLHSQFANDRQSIRQFIRESEIASSLAHPNIVNVWDHGRVAGVHYLVMERIEGNSLLSLLRRANEDGQPAPIGVSIHLLREILLALDYAFDGVDANGNPFRIVHRDLSPSNIVVTSDGRLKVIDFGVARALQGRYATHSGQVKGKLGYMSPEVLAGKTFDGRSDLFSAAVVAWELLTAKRLFRGSESEQLKLRTQNHERTPPSAVNHWVPDEIDRLIAVALAEDPANRWQSAGAMLAALEPQLRKHGAGASSAAVLAWMNRLTVGEFVQVDSETNVQIRSIESDSRGTGNSAQEILSTISSMRSPEPMRFKDSVTTVLDPAPTPACVPTLEEPTQKLANGSSEFLLPVNSDISMDAMLFTNSQTAEETKESICVEEDEPSLNQKY